MKISGPFLVALFSCSIAAHAGEYRSSQFAAGITVAANGTTSTISQSAQDKRPPLKPYPRLLPLHLAAPATAQAGMPIENISVTLSNPGEAAPNARLRVLIHDTDSNHGSGTHEANTDNVTVEVLEGGTWKPVGLAMVGGGVMGAIGAEGSGGHRERHERSGFAVPTGLNKTWQLRVTFNYPGTYTLVTAVSPDNGSRHLAQPEHSIIVVQ